MDEARRSARIDGTSGRRAADLLDDLDRAALAGGGVADLRRHFGMPLPMGVVGELLGADGECRARLHELANLGAHYCLGAPLARLESTIALRSLFTRFPDLSPAVREEGLPRHPSFVGNSVRELPVRPHGRSGAAG